MVTLTGGFGEVKLIYNRLLLFLRKNILFPANPAHYFATWNRGKLGSQLSWDLFVHQTNKQVNNKTNVK